MGAGTILGGKYRLLSEIGSGGMGAVWRAEHLDWEAPVALKVMKPEIMAHPEALARFEREVRLAAGLRSPHVVQVLDHGVDAATGVPFISMELLEGEPLAGRIRRNAGLGPGETFQILSQLVRALSRAHEAGIVHRDLKPDNVFLVENDGAMLAKVLDFGVAKWTQPDVLESGLTRPGSVVGTPYYMSPEQIQGSRDTDHRADLWALAIITCECLTGRRPFEAPDFARLAVLLLGSGPRPVPSSLGPVPPGFDAWFARATDPDISQRFQTARELSQALAPICGEPAPSSHGRRSAALGSTRLDPESVQPLASSASGIRRPASRGQRPLAKLVTATVGTTLLVVGALGFWLMQRDSARLPASPPAAEAPRVVEATAAPRPPSAAPPPPAAGPVVRPLRPPPAPEEPPPAPRIEEEAAAPARAAEEDPEARRRRVRAALLERPRVQRRTARPRPPAARAEPRARPAPPRAAPPKPPDPAPRPSTPAPPLVDGRRIRTTL